MLTYTVLGAPVVAQTIYRSVGPDGKVIFSDQPPGSAGRAYTAGPGVAPAAPGTSSSSKSTESTVAGAPPGPAPSRAVTAGAASGQPLGDAGADLPRGSAKKAMASAKTNEAVAGTASPSAAPVAAPAVPAITAPVPAAKAPITVAPDPNLEGAIIGVLGIEDLVLQTTELCVKTLPTSFKKYSDSADGWRLRNTELVKVARQALAREYEPGQRRDIEQGIRQRNASVFASVNNATSAQRIAWCDRSNDALLRGDMDVTQKPKLAGPLAGYRPR